MYFGRHFFQGNNVIEKSHRIYKAHTAFLELKQKWSPGVWVSLKTHHLGETAVLVFTHFRFKTKKKEMQQNEDEENPPCKQLWLLSGILDIWEQLILAKPYQYPKSPFKRDSGLKLQLLLPHSFRALRWFFLCPRSPGPAEEQQGQHAEGLGQRTYPAVVQGPHPEPVGGPGQEAAHGALQLSPVVHLRNHLFRGCHLHAVLRHRAATFWLRDI